MRDTRAHDFTKIKIKMMEGKAIDSEEPEGSRKETITKYDLSEAVLASMSKYPSVETLPETAGKNEQAATTAPLSVETDKRKEEEELHLHNLHLQAALGALETRYDKDNKADCQVTQLMQIKT